MWCPLAASLAAAGPRCRVSVAALLGSEDRQDRQPKEPSQGLSRRLWGQGKSGWTITLKNETSRTNGTALPLSVPPQSPSEAQVRSECARRPAWQSKVRGPGTPQAKLQCKSTATGRGEHPMVTSSPPSFKKSTLTWGSPIKQCFHNHRQHATHQPTAHDMCLIHSLNNQNCRCVHAHTHMAVLAVTDVNTRSRLQSNTHFTSNRDG